MTAASATAASGALIAGGIAGAIARQIEAELTTDERSRLAAPRAIDARNVVGDTRVNPLTGCADTGNGMKSGPSTRSAPERMSTDVNVRCVESSLERMP